MIQAAQEAIIANMQAMSPEQRQTYIKDLTGTYYEPIAAEIDAGFRAKEGETRVAYARGGMLSSSAAEGARHKLMGQAAREKGMAYINARQAAEQSFFNRERSRLSNVAAGQGLISGIEANRMGTAGRTQTTQYPNMFANDLMSGAGWAITSPDSYLNKNRPSWLGGGSGSSKLTPEQRALTYDERLKLLNYKWGP
jgi:hypothetical protein